MAGRGPTYERVQRLLEERRARASAQMAAQTQDSSPEGHAGQLGRGRLQQVSPDSDRSFEFDRPAFISDAGALAAAQEILRNSSYAAEDDAAWHGASALGALPHQHDQSGWEGPSPSRAQFQPPPGDVDDDYHGEHHDGSGLTASRHGTLRFGQDGLRGAHDASLRLSTPPPDARASSQREGGSGSPTLAELEAMLNQTMLQLNLSTQPLPQPQQRQPARDQPPPGATLGRGLQGLPPQPQQQGDIRVPTNKDMAYGMGGGGEGPFDISDIWAMESQPSASQRSASHSDHAAYRSEDGQEVNSYAAAYGYQRQQQQQQQQQHPSAEEALYGGAVATQRMGSDPAYHPAESTTPGSHLLAGPQSGPANARQGAAAQQRQQQQQQQQQAPRSRATSPGPVGPRPGTGAPPGRTAGQQTTRPQRPVSAQMGGRPAGATVRRSVSPGASPRPRSALQNVPARYNQPPAWQQQYQQQQQQQPQRPRSPDVYPGFSFQPRINPRSREIAERLLPADKERRLEQLSRPHKERFEQRAEQLRQAKLEEELRECSFQPRTGRPPSTPRVRGPTPVHERLYHTKPAWEQKRDDILREREKEVLASCTFQPQCGSRQSPDRGRRSSSAQRQRPASATRGRPGAGHSGAGHGGSGAGAYVPIHQRVADLLRSRNEKLAKAQMKMELDSGPATFQPEINRRSVVLAAERQRQQPADVAALPATERLYRLAQEQRAMSASRRGREGDLGSSYGDGGDLAGGRDQRPPQQPGVPAINPRSRALAESSDLPQDFLARQAYLAALGHEKRALYRSLLEESTCTFQPQLISRGGSLASSGVFGPGPGSAAGDGESRAGREGGGGRLSKLAYEDVQKSAALRDALAQHHYSQFTFTPRINETSRRIGRRHSLTDLYRDEERQAKLERLAAQAEAARAAECTFKPAINPRSASLGRQRRGSLVLTSTDVAEQAHKLRSSILMEARALKEYEELKECTFTPAINRQGPPRTNGPVAVPGLGRHMELKEMARRKKEAEEARKAEVWNQRPKSPGPRVGVTVPQPFSFEQRVLPWQRPRSAVLAEQQHMEAHQKRALATLKSQRLQQRREAEERRSAHLQRIMQEAVGAGGRDGQYPQQQQPQPGGHGQAYEEYGGGSAGYGGEVAEEAYAY